MNDFYVMSFRLKKMLMGVNIKLTKKNLGTIVYGGVMEFAYNYSVALLRLKPYVKGV